MRDIARGALILGALFVGVDMLLSLLSSCDEISHYPSHKQDAKEYCTAFGGPLIGDIRRIFTWVRNALHDYDKEIVATFTVVLTISTSALWWSTRSLWQTTKDDTRILQRAYIRAVPKGVGTMTTGEIVGHVSFENEGKLPATNFKWVVKALTLENGTWKPPALGDSDLLEYSSIVPIAGIFRRGTAAIFPGNPVEDKYWFVWGRVKYLDGFGKERFVDFCHSYPVARRESVDGGGYTIRDEYARYHDYGNDAD